MGNSVPPKTHSKSSLNGTPKPARKSAEKYATGGVFVPIWVNFDNAVEGVEQAASVLPSEPKTCSNPIAKERNDVRFGGIKNAFCAKALSVVR